MRQTDGRFIPAPAGNSSTRPGFQEQHPVHPRACGEQSGEPTYALRDDGSSPRLRGTGITLHGCRLPLRFIPAPAGNRSPMYRRSNGTSVHPRACGEQRCR